MEKSCVLYEVSVGFLMLFWRIPTFNSRDMPQAVSRRSVTTQARVRSHASPLEVGGEQSGIGRGFFPRTSIFLCQYYSTIFHVSSTLYQKTKRMIPGNIPTEKFSFWYWGACCTMAQAVTSRFLTAKTWVQSRTCLRENFGGQNWHWDRSFSR